MKLHPLGAMLYGDPLQRIQVLRQYALSALQGLLANPARIEDPLDHLTTLSWVIAVRMFQKEYERFYESVEDEGGRVGLAQNDKPTVR